MKKFIAYREVEYIIFLQKSLVIHTKKPIFILNKAETNERIRDFYESAYLQYEYLEKKKWRIVYVDEFHVSMHGSSLYNWSPKGHSSILWVDASQWIMSFIVAFSDSQIEGIIASNKSITKQIFCWFLGDIWKDYRIVLRILHKSDSFLIMLVFVEPTIP